jgi:hypothetical protein
MTDEYLLITAMEECGEVTQALSKILRFGGDAEYQGVTARQRAQDEVDDLLATLYMAGFTLHAYHLPKKDKMESMIAQYGDPFKKGNDNG